MSAFSDLCHSLSLEPRLCDTLVRAGYDTPTPVQTATLPAAMQGKDVVASAPTGSGKTIAFVLPALHRAGQRAADPKRSGKASVLILTPTRELALQIARVVTQLTGQSRAMQPAILVGGSDYGPQIRDLRRGTPVIIATPGRLMDHIRSGRVDLSGIDLFILDEADRMLDLGFVEAIAEISRLIPKKRQSLLFSATIAPRLQRIMSELLKPDYERIDLITEPTRASAHITQQIYYADNPDHKVALFEQYLTQNAQTIFKGIIFTATKSGADALAERLGKKAAALHGDLPQRKRNRVLERLRHGDLQILVATDVASRGIDVPDITHVINFDIPKFSEDYVHRIGRTGRAGKNGQAVSFALHSDVSALQRIQRYTQQRIPIAVFPGMEPRKNFDERAPAKKIHKKAVRRPGAPSAGRFKPKPHPGRPAAHRAHSTKRQ